MKQVQKASNSAITPLIWSLVVVLIASLPYIAGLLMQSNRAIFLGFTFNIDDACVYSSWIHQIADGSFLVRNQFTTDPQSALQFNIFFVILGSIARITHLSPAAVLHLARVTLGVALLMMIWRFSGRFLKDRVERSLIVPVVGLASGLGWTMLKIGNHQGPVDIWQPESITFLSIYLNPLFLIGLILMLASVHFLLKMKDTGSVKDAMLAGLMLLVLGNVHTYDVVTVGVVWVAYLVVEIIRLRKIHWKTIGFSVLAAMCALPSLGYQFYLYNHVDAFRERVQSQAPSPALWAYMMGFGLVLVLAVIGGVIASKQKRDVVLLVVWGIVGFAIPYIPVAQQRKLVMGLHIPLAILAVVAIAALVKRVGPRYANIVVIVLVAAMLPSTLFRMGEDIKNLANNTTAPEFRPFMTANELDAIQWLKIHSKPEDAVLTFYETALFIPAVSGNRVYYGHWSETPDYIDKRNAWITFVNAATPDAWRRDFLKSTGARYIIYFSDPNSLALGDAKLVDLRLRSYTKEVFVSGQTAVYEVKL